MLPIVVHSYLELCQPQMVRLLMLPVLQAPAPMGKVSKHIHQIFLKSRGRRSLRIRTGKRENTHNNPRFSKMALVLTQHHPRQIESHSHPLKGTNSISIHHLHQVDTCIHLHCHHHSSIYLNWVRSLYNKIPTQLLHSSRWHSSISNILRQVRTRQKLSRISPAPHPSHPL